MLDFNAFTCKMDFDGTQFTDDLNVWWKCNAWQLIKQILSYYNINIFLNLIYIILFLEIVQHLSKFVQNQDIFICDFVVAMKKRDVSNVLWWTIHV
jgi:hypothetical protein